MARAGRGRGDPAAAGRQRGTALRPLLGGPLPLAAGRGAVDHGAAAGLGAAPAMGRGGASRHELLPPLPGLESTGRGEPAAARVREHARVAERARAARAAPRRLARARRAGARRRALAGSRRERAAGGRCERARPGAPLGAKRRARGEACERPRLVGARGRARLCRCDRRRRHASQPPRARGRDAARGADREGGCAAAALHAGRAGLPAGAPPARGARRAYRVRRGARRGERRLALPLLREGGPNPTGRRLRCAPSPRVRRPPARAGSAPAGRRRLVDLPPAVLLRRVGPGGVARRRRRGAQGASAALGSRRRVDGVAPRAAALSRGSGARGPGGALRGDPSRQPLQRLVLLERGAPRLPGQRVARRGGGPAAGGGPEHATAVAGGGCSSASRRSPSSRCW